MLFSQYTPDGVLKQVIPRATKEKNANHGFGGWRLELGGDAFASACHEAADELTGAEVHFTYVGKMIR